MIVDELAYRVTLRAEEFLTGKKKVQQGQEDLQKSAKAMGKGVSDSMGEVGRSSREAGNEVERTTRKTKRNLKGSDADFKQFGNSAVRAFNGAGKAMAGFLGVGVGLYGLKQLFGSTATEITRASNAAKFFGSDVNRVFGLQRGFKQVGLNGDAFIGAAGSARMALANIADPTVMGGLTGQAQNLITLGARTGLNVNELGDPTKALAEFTRYGQSHDQSNLMQVMSSAGFDPSDAAKIKSGELKQLVDSETKKSKITQQQVREQENLLKTLGELDSQFTRLRQDIAKAFAPAVIEGMKAFGSWMENNSGDIIGFFESSGATVKAFTEAVGGAENALKLLAAAYVGSKATGGVVPPWLAGLIAYGTYLYGDRENIKDAAESSWNYTKRNIGDALDSVGIHTDLGRREGKEVRAWPAWMNWAHGGKDGPIIREGKANGVVHGDNIQNDIPGASNIPDRHNNPGNLRPVGGDGFRRFASEEEGWAAMEKQLELYYTGRSAAAGHKKLQTLRDIISTYAPPTENDTEKYISTVAGWMGVQPEQRLNLESPAVMAKLRSSMARYEGATNWQRGISPEQVEQYKLQMQYSNMPQPSMQSVDRSQSSSVHINTVEVKTNPATADALTESIKQRAARSLTNGAFASAVS